MKDLVIHIYDKNEELAGEICTNEKLFRTNKTTKYAGSAEYLKNIALVCIRDYENTFSVRTGESILSYLFDNDYLIVNKDISHPQSL